MKKNTLMDSVCDNRQAMEATGMLRTLMAVVAAAVCTNASIIWGDTLVSLQVFLAI